LHSKYLYLTAKAFFDEHGNEVTCSFHGKSIEINEYSFIHIYNRHLASAVKQFPTEKSFHRDEKISWFELPLELKSIVDQVGSHPSTVDMDIEFFPIKYNGIVYGIATKRKMKTVKGNPVVYNRLSTFYPLDREEDLKKTRNNYREVLINGQLTAYVKKTRLRIIWDSIARGLAYVVTKFKSLNPT
jgi:hypothetical protein